MKSIIDRFIDGQTSAIIKVIGVGGGGCNAVENLYRRGLENVTFAVCNSDAVSLQACCVPTRIPIGVIGAGDIPERGYEAALEHEDVIRKTLSDGTQMLFITAGMGGGTGTGASPVVARIARELGILTVGIVTTPFLFEGKAKMNRSSAWIKRLSANVDAIIVINNEKLTQMEGYLLPEAFLYADQVLANAAESILKLVILKGYLNVDFADVCTTLRSGHRAVISTGVGKGQNRVTKAIQSAADSMLTEDVDWQHCNRLLLNFYCSSTDAITTQELNEVEEFTGRMMENVEIKWGMNIDGSLGSDVKVTLLASGDW